MKSTLNKLKENIIEVINERLFSPMYFYFIIAWLITNWKFVYILIFADTKLVFNEIETSKIDLLSNLYKVNSPVDLWFNLTHLFLIPLLFSFVAVWWLTKASEVFFHKYETYKQNKRITQRELEYKEKVRFFNIEREIRESESDKKDIKYEDNKAFNGYLDNIQDSISIGNINLRPSEVLYNTDYEAYKESLKEWREIPDDF